MIKSYGKPHICYAKAKFVSFIYAIFRALPLRCIGFLATKLVSQVLKEQDDMLIKLNYSKSDIKKFVEDSIVNYGKGMAETIKMQGTRWGFDVTDVKQKVLWNHSRKDKEVPFVCVEEMVRHLPEVNYQWYDEEPHVFFVMFKDLINTLKIECE